MRKMALMSFVACMLVFSASASQAALIELSPLSDFTAPPPAGSLNFGVYLTDKGALPNVDLFNLWIMVTGATGLEMRKADVTGPAQAGYIFSGNTFSFTVANPGGNLSQVAIGDVTSNGTGANPANGNLLAMLTLRYPALAGGTVLSFSLDPNQNFVQSDAATNAVFESLTLAGKTQIQVPGTNPVPLPGAILLFGPTIMGLFGLRRKFLKH